MMTSEGARPSPHFGNGSDADPGRTPRRVLVAEDETMLALSLETMLGDWGYEVIASVATGAGAIRAATELRPDIILMDVHLADDIDGLAAAAEISATARIPVIFMTAYSDHDIAGRPQPGSQVLFKPFPPERLRSALNIAGEGR